VAIRAPRARIRLPRRRAGYRVLRFTDRQLTHEPATVVATLAAALRLQ
jgi:very-short-patch-repair endonuclease